MHGATGFILPFAAGVALGSGLVFALMKSRLRLYRHMIEQRLSDANQRFIQMSASRDDRWNEA